MKILMKKLKKVSMPKKIFYLLTIVAYLATYIYFIIGLKKLAGIETLIRIIIILFFGIWYVIYLLGGLLGMLSKKKTSFIVITTISLILCPIFFYGSSLIQRLTGYFDQAQKENLVYTTSLVALKANEFTANSVIGMVDVETDIEGNELAKKLIEKEQLTNKIKNFEDISSMIRALYNGEIDACFVSKSTLASSETYTEDEDGPKLADKVNIIKTYSEEMANQDAKLLENSKTKQITEPFTVLIMGVDSEDDGLNANQAFNGDTLIMVTFNPNTLTTTMFSIPRDLYVPISCNHNRYAKINSAAAYGSSCVIGTVQQLTGIDIDFYVKINFKGVVDLVDVLGGVTVDVEEPDFNWNAGVNCNGRFCEQNSNREFGDKMIYLDPGVQTLNGEEALAYARCRHLYALSDIARNQHQQQIIEAMAQKIKTMRSISDFENVLNTITKNIETNMTTEQILSFYNVGKSMIFNNDDEDIAFSIKKTYLTFYNLTVWRGYDASCLGYYQSSLDAITKLMRVNLGLEKATVTKTFSIAYNEDYKTPLVGEGLYGGEKLETLPNFIGYAREYVEEWCSNNGVSCSFETINGSAPKGEIIDQSLHEHTLVKAINEKIVFQISNGTQAPLEEEDNEDENEDNEDNNESETKKDNNDEDDNTSESGNEENSEESDDEE